MLYTLDSLAHAKQCIADRFKANELTITEKFCKLEDLRESEDTFHFGVVTIGNNNYDLQFYNYEPRYLYPGQPIPKAVREEIINVKSNNQIILLFQHYQIYTDTPPTEPPTYNGQFRGYEIIVKQ